MQQAVAQFLAQAVRDPYSNYAALASQTSHPNPFRFFLIIIIRALLLLLFVMVTGFKHPR